MSIEINKDTQKMLNSQFDSKVESIIISYDPAHHIDSILFNLQSGVAFKLTNEMVELGDRLEEGTIIFEENKLYIPGATDVKIELNDTISSSKINYFVHPQNGNTGICGIEFSLNDSVHRIFVGAAPYTLVFQSNLINDSKLPEYPFENYMMLE